MLTGLAIAAPVGPIGVLCIQRTLLYGRKAGFLTGLGAASADAVYGTAAALGLSVISAYMLTYGFWLQVAGALFLTYIGCRSLFLHSSAASAGPVPPRGGYGSGFLLTMANPLTILSFTALLGAFGSAGNGLSSFLLVAGVFAGSAIWWAILSSAAGWFRNRLAERHSPLISRISGAILAGTGILLLAGAVYDFT
ncbi:LysE family translocator [Metabacillus mangrovi]|nr:LysE family transporter [Metabacillus mangrovi]